MITSKTENEYGCVLCQVWHGESDGPIYAEHLLHQSKHGLRRRPLGGWPVPACRVCNDTGTVWSPDPDGCSVYDSACPEPIHDEKARTKDRLADGKWAVEDDAPAGDPPF